MRTHQLAPSSPSVTGSPSFVPMRGRVLQRKCACGGESGPTAECGECRKKRQSVQRQPDREQDHLPTNESQSSSSDNSTVPRIVFDVLRSPGQPLDATTRQTMQVRLGHDFSAVRVHTDPLAAQSALAVAARAYTVGSNVVFGSGRYAPSSREGQHLLAHELTHVVQQRGASTEGPLTIQDANDPAERAAESVAAGVAQPRPAVADHRSASAVLQRDSFGSRVTGGPPGVPAEKWSANSENTFRRIGQDYRANAIRECRIRAGAACTRILTAEEARAAYRLAKEGYSPRDAALQTTKSQQTLARTPAAAIPLVVGGEAAGGAAVAPAVVAALPAAAVVAVAALFAASLTEEVRISRFIDILEASGFVVLTNLLGECIRGCHGGPTARPVSRTFPLDDTLVFAQALPRPLAPVSPSHPFFELTKPAPRGTPTEEPTPVPNPKTTVDVLPNPQTRTEPETERQRRRKRCRDASPTFYPLPIIWPAQLPPFEEHRPLERTSSDEREAQGTDRGPDQRRYRDCLTSAHDRGQDLQVACGHLGGDWFDPDLLSAEHVDAHHMQPLYLGGEDAPYNLGAVEFNRHRRGHPLLDNQTLMFETNATWIAQRVCSPFLVDHPAGQEYEPVFGF